MSTQGNNSAPDTARLLIKELTMRTTLLSSVLLSTVLFGCVGEVGGGGAGRGRESGREDEGSGSDDDESCEDVNTAITIRSVSDFDDLPTGCWDLFAPLTIQGSEITSLAKLGKLKAVNELTLIGTNLTTLDTAANLTVYGPVTVTGNNQLRDLKKLVVGTGFDVAIKVENNAALTSLDGLATVLNLQGDLTITGNAKLASASLSLQSITGSIRVADNAALTSLGLTSLTTMKGLEITNNAALTNLGGLGATTINGSLVVRGNRALTSLGTMSSLSQINGSLTIDNNAALANISAFTTSMTAVVGPLTISNNAALTDLGGISHLQAIGPVAISNNARLSFCRAQEVDHCVTNHGAVTIQNNLAVNQDDCSCWCGR